MDSFVGDGIDEREREREGVMMINGRGVVFLGWMLLKTMKAEELGADYWHSPN